MPLRLDKPQGRAEYSPQADVTTELLEKLRREDSAALVELGQALLPFVQAAVLAETFQLPEPVALLRAYREEVGLAVFAATDSASISPAVLSRMRARAASIPALLPDLPQAEALGRLQKLRPLATLEREMVVARFVERLPPELCCAHFGVDATALGAVLARGAVLLVGPAAAGEWTAVPSLLDPDGDPIAQFVELETAAACLAIDVTALDDLPLSAAPPPVAGMPVLRPGLQAQAPQEHYPSRIETQGLVDLPAEMSALVAGLPGVAPRVVLEETTQASGVALQPLDPSTLTNVPTVSMPKAESTEPRAAPLPPPFDEATAATGRPLPPPVDDTTAANARPLYLQPVSLETPGADDPFARVSGGQGAAAIDKTVVGDFDHTHVKPLNVAAAHLGARSPENIFAAEGKGYFADVADKTHVGRDLRPRALSLYRRLPSRWLFGGAMFCALLGASLYTGLLWLLKGRVQRSWHLVPVVAAARDLPEGTKIELELLAVRSVPEENVTASVVRPGSIEYAIGQKLEFPLQAGDPLLWSQFDPTRKSKRFEVIKHGRAYTIGMTGVKSLGGMLVPKEEVDLVMLITPEHGSLEDKPQTRAVTLLQKVRVLAVGAVTTLNVGKVQRLSTDVTLMLVPEEVEVLSLARQSGEITATLRNPEDEEVISRGETSTTTLLSGIRMKAVLKRRGQMISNVRSQ